jgi:hypothetical protein
MTVLARYLPADNALTFETLCEALNMAKVHVAQLDKRDFPELHGAVYSIRNESPIVDALITMLGIPRNGTAYRIRTGFMAYDEQNKILFFSSYKYDLPGYLGKRPKPIA